MTILATLALLILVTILTFALGRNALTEVASSGTVWQSARASEAAEAGLDWYLLWTNPENAAAATDRDRQRLVEAFRQLNTLGAWQSSPYLLNPGWVDSAGVAWDRAILVGSTEGSSASDMVLTRSGTGFLQTGLATVQSFDVTVRYLGKSDVAEVSAAQGGTGSTAGGATQQTGLASSLYQVQGIGKASVPTGLNTYVRFSATREMFVTVAP